MLLSLTYMRSPPQEIVLVTLFMNIVVITNRSQNRPSWWSRHPDELIHQSSSISLKQSRLINKMKWFVSSSLFRWRSWHWKDPVVRAVALLSRLSLSVTVWHHWRPSRSFWRTVNDLQQPPHQSTAEKYSAEVFATYFRIKVAAVLHWYSCLYCACFTARHSTVIVTRLLLFF